jgi:hypothetical protein
MEGRMAKHGRREYVQVLRLLESFDLADLHAAVKQLSNSEQSALTPSNN